MEQGVSSATNLWPYSERNGVTAAEDIQAILAPPEQELSELERTEARLFAQGLYIGYWHDACCEAPRTLESIHAMGATEAQQTFYPGYFKTEQGQQDLETLQVGFEEVADTLHDVYKIRATIDDKLRKEISSRSTNWYRDAIAEHLTEPAGLDGDFRDTTPIVVHYNPDKLLDKFTGLQAFRRFYRAVWQDIKTLPESALKQAQQTILEVYMAQVNNLVADLYPDMCSLATQVDHNPGAEESKRWAAKLAEVAPIVSLAYANQEDFRQDDAKAYLNGFARRLDLVRNGAASGEQQYTPISENLLELAQDIEQRNGEGIEIDASQVQFTTEELAVMDNTVWDAEAFTSFSEDVLQEWDLLSEYTFSLKEAQDRDGRAPDGKWQVVVRPGKSLAIDGAKGVVWVPQKFKRTLTQESPGGVLPISAHELTHVWQNEHDRVLAEQIPLTQIKGRRYLTVREMGGMEQERAIQAAFGRTATTKLNYLRALQAKLAGGTQLQAARAFYNSAVDGRQLDIDADATARDTAADRTMRLYRHGGHDSQPLDYIEQDALASTLDHLDEDRRRAIIIAGGSLSWSDAAKLHRAGLFELPTSVACNPVQDIIRIFKERYLPALV